MKKIIMIFLICLFSAFLLQPETIANVTSYKNLTLTIDRGCHGRRRNRIKGHCQGGI